MNPIRRRDRSNYPGYQFQDDMSGAMQRFFTDPFFWNDDFLDSRSGFQPALNVEEKADRYVVEAEVPGMDPKDIHLEVHGHVLTIRGERRREQKEENEDSRIHRMESSYGSFHRSFTLPEDANLEDISADTKSGVVFITVPKDKVKEPRKIDIRHQDHEH